MSDKKIFNSKEAAAYLCVTPSGFSTWCKPTFLREKGYGLSVRYKNGIKYYTKEDLDAFLEIKLKTFKRHGELQNYLAKLKAKGTIQ